MQKTERIIPYLLAVVFLCLTGWLLQDVQQYVFFHREQQQILAWDADLLFERFHGVGGFSLLLAQSLTQFFCIPYMGAVLTAVLALASACLLWMSLRKINASVPLFPLCFLPACFELSNLNDAYYQYQGFVAFCLMTLFVALYAAFLDKLKRHWRVVFASILALLLFYWTGPMALVFALYLVVIDAATKQSKKYLTVPLVLVALTCFYAVRWCWVPTMRTGFSQDFYYNPLVPAPASFKYAWVSVVLLPIVFWVLKRFHFAHYGVRIVASLLLFAGVAGVQCTLAAQNREDTDPLLEMQHHAIVEDWDAILNSPLAYSRNSLLMNYVNLALSHKGLLVSHLYSFEQPDENNFLVYRAVDDTNVPLSFIYSLVTYQMGDQGAAQNNAFDTFVGTTYGNPYMLQMLVKTNLIAGAYPVAEKYINLLEKTVMYADWATGMRKFLRNDKAILEDPDMGRMRRDLAKDDSFTQDTFLSLFKTLEANPADPNTRDYLVAYLLVNRDKDYINRFVEQFQHTPALDPMPIQVEEMMLMVNDPDFDYCRVHGAKEETIQRFQQMVMAYEDATRRNQNPAAVLRKEYGKTVWYQFLFN
ncbi:MAG: hypothetical protein HUJ99_06730 [Bacteroidaceae bacterium]|nr:hypothetical protein [Bacteroidaceae bacterium]